MKKSATVAVAATASSFITEARELLRFHFWFGSLRCSFVIKGRERRWESPSSIDSNSFVLTPRTTLGRTVLVFNFNCFFSSIFCRRLAQLRLQRAARSGKKKSFSPRHSFGEYFAGEVKQTFDDLTTLVVWKEHIVRVIAHKLIAERRKRFEATRVEKKRKKRKSKPWKSWNEYQWGMMIINEVLGARCSTCTNCTFNAKLSRVAVDMKRKAFQWVTGERSDTPIWAHRWQWQPGLSLLLPDTERKQSIFINISILVGRTSFGHLWLYPTLPGNCVCTQWCLRHRNKWKNSIFLCACRVRGAHRSLYNTRGWCYDAFMALTHHLYSLEVVWLLKNYIFVNFPTQHSWDIHTCVVLAFLGVDVVVGTWIYWCKRCRAAWVVASVKRELESREALNDFFFGWMRADAHAWISSQEICFADWQLPIVCLCTSLSPCMRPWDMSIHSDGSRDRREKTVWKKISESFGRATYVKCISFHRTYGMMNWKVKKSFSPLPLMLSLWRPFERVFK